MKTLIMLFVVALVARPAGAASFTASLDRDAITLGESTTLALAFEGAQPNNLPMPSVSGLQITQTGTSQSVNIVNGAMSSTVTVSFSVKPQRPGEFTIPALTANVNGQHLASAPLKLVVSKASAPSANAVNSGSEVAFLKFTFPKSKIYVGQSVVAQLELCLRDDVQNYGNLQLSPLNIDGFSAGKIVEGQKRRAQIGNRIYTIVPILIPLTAVKSGALNLGPFNASVVIVLPGQNQGGDPFFRQFFNQGEQKQVALATEPLSLESLTLPKPNQPANFTGAVGQFELAATAGPTTVTVGDPITVRVQISGRGSLDSIALPAQDAWKNFKTYPPTTKLENTDQFGFQGTKTFEQIISPLNNDVRELPALSFSYFNPEDGQYHTLTQPAVPLAVQAAGATPMPQMAATKSSNEEKPAQDILPIKEKLGSLVAGTPPLVAQPVFLAVQTVPVLAFLAAFVWRKRTDNLANNPRLRRQRAVAALVANGLNDLKNRAAANQPDEFFATLFRLLQEQLGERLDCPASAITEDVVDGHALLRNAPADLRTALHEQFQLCNQARYAPVRGTSELNSVAAQFEKLIGQLREVKP
ncbi:MAG: BatD family protein [Verrucomicrobiota bacterium]